MVHGDPVRILQVCLNLLTNAVKFTESGNIDFSVSTVDYCEALHKGCIRKLPGAPVCYSDCGVSSNDIDDHHGVSTTVGSDETGDFSTLLLEDAENGSSPKNKGHNSSSFGPTVLKIRVEDTGCGIPPEQIDRIFQPYSMAKLAQYRQQGGTGLGLSIISKLTGIMHGTVKVRSSVGIGSVFEAYVVVEHATLSTSFGAHIDEMKTSIPPPPPPLPMLTIHEPAKGPATSGDVVMLSSPSNSLSKPTKPRLPTFDLPSNGAVVLVVDDNAMNRKLLTRMLKSFNLEYQEACNGREAVAAMLRSRNYTNDESDPLIGFVLMDLSMPVMSGTEAIKSIRNHGIDVPIMALTAAAIDEGRDGAIAAGATDYSTKRTS
jgi:CheY-like chemotaxis protein